MTIALGILGKDALILAADSQEGTGYAGDLKLNSTKIALEGTINTGKTKGAKDRIVAVTGAGNSAYLLALKRELLDAFKQSADLDSFELKISDLVLSFYERHVIPFSPQQWGDLGIEVIVAAKLDGVCGMWKTAKNIVTRSDTLAVLGSGESWVRHFTKGAMVTAPLGPATILAAYSVFVAKERAEGCGKETLIIAIPKAEDMFYVADKKSIDRMEQCFAEYEEEERRSFWKPLGLGWDDADRPQRLSRITKQLISIDPYALFRPPLGHVRGSEVTIRRSASRNKA